ncbi:MAG TPA: hypothetical protein VMU33_08305 [Burkholderiaceae bacterium]|nr:hypothetical protein [Burkholderiaceae bacterium]
MVPDRIAAVSRRMGRAASVVAWLLVLAVAPAMASDAQGAAAVVPAVAAPAAGRWTGSLQTWAYATRQALVDDSPLNPDDAIAALPQDVATGDVRLDLKYASDELDVVARPRLLVDDSRGRVAGGTTHEEYLSQAYLRWRPAPSVAATVGRDAFDWGPANFRSPSNPFYFDAGRTNPLRDVSGIDIARLTMVSGATILTAAWIAHSGHDAAGDPYRETSLLKADRRGEDWLASLALATQRHGSGFVGAFAQANIGEPWLVYAEFGSQRLPLALQPTADGSSAPFTVAQPSPRASSALGGVAYTLVNGQTITAEYLRDNHGYGPQAERAYFGRVDGLATLLRIAPASPAQQGAASAGLGEALGDAPRLLGRNYLYLLWQGNPNLGDAYWRAGWTGNLDDRSGQFALYGEYNVATQATLFAALTVNHGPRDSEFPSLMHGAVTVGAKFFVF